MKNKIKLLQLVQFVLSFITVFLVFILDALEQDTIYISNGLVWIPFVIYIIFIALIIGEFILKSTPIVRVVFLSITVFSSLICLSESLSLAAACLIVFDIPYFFILLVVILKKKYLKTNDVVIKNNKVWPEGIYAKKEFVMPYIFFFVLIAIVILQIIVFMNLTISPFYSLIIIVPASIIYVVLVVKTSTLNKMLYEINQNMDYKEFQKRLEMILKNPIHPETYNFLMLLNANYLFAYSKEDAITTFEKTHIPSKKNILLYNIIETEYLINIGKYDEALKNIEKLKGNQKIGMQNFYKVFATKEEMLNIEALYPEQGKIKFTTAVNLYTKMYYYYTRNNLELAKDCARKIIDYCPLLLQYVQEANDILNEVQK